MGTTPSVSCMRLPPWVYHVYSNMYGRHRHGLCRTALPLVGSSVSGPGMCDLWLCVSQFLHKDDIRLL